MELNSYQLQDEHPRQNKSNILSISGNTNYLYLKMSMWMLFRLRAGNSCFDSWHQQKIFLLSRSSRPTTGALPSSYTMGRLDLFLGKKRSVCEINHSAQPSAKVKNKYIYTSTTSVHLNVVDRTTLHFIHKSVS